MNKQKDVQPILDKVLAGERLTAEDATVLLESYDIAKIGAAAHEIRMRKNPTEKVTYIIDRNINYTNV
jgi:cyclic dehypoxanthinyl futalosine synthase